MENGPKTKSSLPTVAIAPWATRYDRGDLRPDLAAGLTVGAMLVPQAMAYALLAGLPPEIGLYASVVPVIIYALFGSSRQLAVGPVAIVSLLTAAGLAPLVQDGTAAYLEAAALLALIVGGIHLVLGLGRLGFVVNFLSHAVLVGFTAAAALIIGFSQAKHLFGISVPRSSHFYETVRDVAGALDATHLPTLAVGLGSVITLLALKRWAKRVPGALVVVVGATLAVRLFGLDDEGVKTVGEIPDSLPAFALPFGGLDDGTSTLELAWKLVPTALVITLVGFMESIAVAKVYARRHRYEVHANTELVGLGAANVAAGVFGGYPVTGGFSRTAVNDTAGARTPLASLITATIVLATLAFLTPLFTSLPNAALAAIIIVAVTGLVDVAEMRHIATVKRSDLWSLGTAFAATLVLGIELGIGVAVAMSVLVVFARMSTPHSAVLGRVEGTTSYRNVSRFPEVVCCDGVRVVRIDAALSFVNAVSVKRLVLDHAAALQAGSPRAEADASAEVPRWALVLDGSGINDLDATGSDMLVDLADELDSMGIALHLCDMKGPVRDVLRRSGLWDRLGTRVHTSTHDAVQAIAACRPGPADQRRAGIDDSLPAQERAVPTSLTDPASLTLQETS